MCAGSRALRHCYALYSWFRIPEQGMTTYELLARASAFPVQGRRVGAMHLLGCAHVTHPFLYTNYYTDEWLQFVREEHVRYSLRVLLPSGDTLHELPLVPRVFRHEEFDLCALHFEEDDKARDSGVRPITLSAACPEPGQSLLFAGNEIVRENDTERQVPRHLTGNGSFSGVTSTFRFFGASERELQMGMCGGPAMSHVEDSDGMTQFSAVGMVEGIVPRDSSVQALAGQAACIKGSTIVEFLSRVEEQLLVGTDAD